MMSSGQLASSILQLALAMILRAFPDLSPSVTSAAASPHQSNFPL
jgi:hypothetical protein